MTAVSAGVLLYRRAASAWEVLLVHPGGPFWRRRDPGAWSIPKGEAQAGEDLAAAALRELREELGDAAAPCGPLAPLGSIRQRAGKQVHAYALRGDFDPALLRSNTFELEWPPRSGRIAHYPEVDRAAWFDFPTARDKIIEGQRPFLDRLRDLLEQA